MADVCGLVLNSGSADTHWSSDSFLPRVSAFSLLLWRAHYPSWVSDQGGAGGDWPQSDPPTSIFEGNILVAKDVELKVRV